MHAQNLVSPCTRAVPVANVNDTHSMKRKILTRTTFLYAALAGNRAGTLLLRLLVQLSPLVVVKLGLGQQAYMVNNCTVDKSQTTHRQQLATMYDRTCQKNHNRAMAAPDVLPTGVWQTGVH